MITDQQFIDAIRHVTTEDPNRIAPGTYWAYDMNKNGSGAYCVVGKALESIGAGLCPQNNTNLAFPLLTGLGCSDRVGVAAAVAQYINDVRAPFRESMWAFERALALFDAGPPPDATSMRNYIEVLTMKVRDEHLRRVALYAAQMPKEPTVMPKVTAPKNYANGGVINLSDLYASASLSSADFVAACTYGMSYPVAKKDHALTA